MLHARLASTGATGCNGSSANTGREGRPFWTAYVKLSQDPRNLMGRETKWKGRVKAQFGPMFKIYDDFLSFDAFMSCIMIIAVQFDSLSEVLLKVGADVHRGRDLRLFSLVYFRFIIQLQ